MGQGHELDSYVLGTTLTFIAADKAAVLIAKNLRRHRMAPRTRSVRFLVLAAATTACATTRFQGGVDAYRGTGVGVPAPSMHRIAVAVNTSEANTLFAMEVKHKLESLLRMQGYRVSSVDSADFVLLNAFGIGSPQTVSTGGVVLPLRNMIVYTPTSATTYFRWLLLGFGYESRDERRSAPRRGLSPCGWLRPVSEEHGQAGGLCHN